MIKTNEKLPEHVYRHFYDQDYIKPKEIAYLICDKDPRLDKLTDSNPKFKNIKQRIYDAAKNKKFSFSGKYSVNKPIDCKILFNWAASTFDDFRKKLPVDLIVCYGSANISLLPLSVEAFAFNAIPQTYEEILPEHKHLITESQKKDIKILKLSKEVARLSVFEKESIAKKSDSAKGGRNSKGKKKTYK